jgi:hypothetical protein
LTKSEFRDMLFNIWNSLDEDKKNEMAQKFQLFENQDSINEILTINRKPLYSDLDIFYSNMKEGKFDKIYSNESIIDRKIANLEYKQMIQKNFDDLIKQKSAKNLMKLQFHKPNLEIVESSSCSTYDSNFEENDDSEMKESKISNIILRHKKSLRMPIFQKNQSSVSRNSKVV